MGNQVRVAYPTRGFELLYPAPGFNGAMPSAGSVPYVSNDTPTIKADDRFLDLAFIGSGAADSTFTFEVYGLAGVTNRSPITGVEADDSLVVPVLLASGTATLGTAVGVEDTRIPDTMRFADTLAVTFPATPGPQDTGIIAQVRSNADNKVALLTLDTAGFLSFHVLISGPTTTNTNVLWKTH